MAQIILRRSTVTSTYLFRKIPSEFFGNNTRYRRELAFQRTHRAIKYGFISGKPLHSHLFYHWAAYKTVKLIKCRFLDWLLRTNLQTHDWQWLLNWITCLRVRTYGQTICTMSISRWRTTKWREAFSIFFLVTEKFYCELDEQIICRYSSLERALKRKYLKYQEILRHILGYR